MDHKPYYGTFIENSEYSYIYNKSFSLKLSEEISYLYLFKAFGHI